MVIVPIVRVTKKGIRYGSLKPFFVVSLIRVGIVPKISPTKMIEVIFK